MLGRTSLVVTISAASTSCLQRRFPSGPIRFVPYFRAGGRVAIGPNSSSFVLCRNGLSMVRGARTTLFLVQGIFDGLSYHYVVTNVGPPTSLLGATTPCPGVRVRTGPSRRRVGSLVRGTRVRTLVAFRTAKLGLGLLGDLFTKHRAIIGQLVVTNDKLRSLYRVTSAPSRVIYVYQGLVRASVTPRSVRRHHSFLCPACSGRCRNRRLLRLVCRM